MDRRTDIAFHTRQRTVNIVNWARQQSNGIVWAVIEAWTWQPKPNRVGCNGGVNADMSRRTEYREFLFSPDCALQRDRWCMSFAVLCPAINNSRYMRYTYSCTVRKLGCCLNAEQNSSIARGNQNWHRSYDRGQSIAFCSGQTLRPRNP